MSESENEIVASAEQAALNSLTANRRSFLHSAVTTGAALAGAGLLTGCATGKGAAATAGAQAANQPRSNESPLWDMSWQQKLGRYKTVFEAPEPAGGNPMFTVSSVIAGYKAAMPQTAKQFTPVLVLRHQAAFTTINDAMWKRIKAHERINQKDVASTQKYAERNPFLVYTPGADNNIIGADSSLTALMAEGTIVLVCNRALNVLASGLRRLEPNNFKTNEEALVEIRKNLHPGVIPMPNGLFAVAAAQDAGCGYMPIAG